MNYFEDQIEDYLLGLLTEEQKISFERELLDNLDLQKSLKEQRLLLSNLDKLRIKNKVDKIIKNAKSYNSLGIFFRIAAIVIILFGVFILLKPGKVADPILVKDKTLTTDTSTIVIQEKLPQEEESNNVDQSPLVDTDSNVKNDPIRLLKLASKFITLTEFSGLRSDDDSEIDNVFEQIKKNLASKNFSEALQYLSSIDSLQQNEYVMMLKADCLFKLKRYNESSIVYSKLSSSFQYKYDAEWNLMLCNLLINKRQKFEIALKAILKDKDHPYYDKAKELEKMTKEIE